MIGTVKILPPELGAKTPPEGYGPLVHPPVGLETLAKGLLVELEGTRALFKSDGITYLARVEPHPPAPERGLKTWHKGVTVYEAEPPSGHPAPWVLALFVIGVGTVGYFVGSALGK